MSWTETFHGGGVGGEEAPVGLQAPCQPGLLGITPTGALGHLRLWALAAPHCPWLHWPIFSFSRLSGQTGQKEMDRAWPRPGQRPCRAGPLDT